MARQRSANNNGGYSPAANPAKIIHSCRKSGGCSGTCPLKVIVHKARSDNPACCKICNTKYSVPSWAEELFEKPSAKSGRAESTPIAKLARLEKQNAVLLKQVQTFKAGRKQDLSHDERPRANISDLQALLDLATKCGSEESIQAATKALDEAKKRS